MKGLFLCGYGCKSWIWENVYKKLNNCDEITLVDWPVDLTKDFNDISDFSAWVKNNYCKENEYDFIVSHSMGGLIALQLLAEEKINFKYTFLVESYLTSPGKFFQNILMDSTRSDIKEKVIHMLNTESKFYSKDLGNKLKNLDLTYLVSKIKSNIHLIYGDRGINCNKKVLKELGLSEEICSLLNIHIVPNSCHFPMIENCEEIANILNDVLK